ncbi:MAG TPA: glycosyltransferase [bacterium]|nr:glycosyltransferase [bacterium]
MRVAIVHDWLTGMRGGEKVLMALMELFQGAELFTLVYQPEKMDPVFHNQRITTSLLQRLPFGKTRYQYYLPLYWELMGGFDLSDYDMIISSSSACAKWVRNPRKAMHVCYCHTPMRYIWDLFDDYFGPSASPLVRWPAKLFRPYLQRCDLRSNEGVTHFVANSTEVQERIKRIYGRESEVFHPPVDVEKFKVKKEKGEYYLVISALVPYKKVELAVRVCTARKWPLLVVGKGSEEKRLRAMAGPTVTFKGWADNKELPGYYAGAKALLFPGKEDFGIVPVEALACGCPVIAFGEGGVKDTLKDGETGVLFHEQTEDALMSAIERFEKMKFSPSDLREMAMPFSKGKFKYRMQVYFRKLYGVKIQEENLKI